VNDAEYLVAQERAYRAVGIGFIVVAVAMLVLAVVVAAIAIWWWTIPLP
jgi:hypothetical protein